MVEYNVEPRVLADVHGLTMHITGLRYRGAGRTRGEAGDSGPDGNPGLLYETSEGKGSRALSHVSGLPTTD